jgi:diguanylate cyclase (GGDEF)-like protein/PAS domain S-box-containing protein
LGESTGYWVSSFIVGALTAVVALYIWRKRVIPGATALFVLMIAATEWAVGNALQIMSSELSYKILWGKFQYIGIVTTPLACFIFVLQYSGQSKWLNWQTFLFLILIPFITLFLAWSYPRNNLVWNRVTLSTDGPFPMAVFSYGSWFWVWTAYAYLLLLLTVILLVQTFVRSPPLYRKQVSVLLVGVTVPWIGNLIYVFGLSPLAHLDITPFAFSVTGLALAWGLLRFRLQDIVPVARETVFEGMRDGVLVLDARDRIVDMNSTAQRIVGSSSSEVIGRSAKEVFVDRQDLVESYDTSREVHKELSIGGGEAKRFYDLVMSPLYDRRKHQIGRLLVLRDISERKHAEEELRRLATTDSLTGMFNRGHFLELSKREVGRALRYHRPLSLMMIDIDHFKRINDNYGHDAGDRVLQTFALVGRDQIRDVDIFGRIGGEEFAILLPDTDFSSAGEVAERLRREVERTGVAVRDETVKITISIGVSTVSASIQNLDSLMTSADKALYKAKWEGRNRVRYANISEGQPQR